MLRKFLIPIISIVFAVNTACSTMDANSANSAANANNANIPPEFSASPLPAANNPIPGITDSNSANSNSLPKGTTPTPGIPDEKNLGKPLPKGTTPTPGIPDEKKRKEQMSNVSSNSKVNQKSSETESDNNKKP